MSDKLKIEMSFAELIDKLAIAQIKETLLPPDKAERLTTEIKKIEHDIDLMITDRDIKLSAEFIRIVVLLAQTNLLIWYNKDKMIEEPDKYLGLLKFAQDLNGIRNYIKNSILQREGEATPASLRATFLKDNGSEWYNGIIRQLGNASKNKRVDNGNKNLESEGL